MTKLGGREIGSQRTVFANRSATANDEDKVVTGVLFRRPDPTSDQINCEVYLEGEHEPVLAFFYARMTMTFGDELVGQTFGAIRRQFRERDIAQAGAARAAKSYSFTLTTTAMPTQAQGRTDDDRPYYFRARHGEWALHIGRRGWPENFDQWPSLGIGQISGSDETHGHMSEEQVRSVLDRYWTGTSWGWSMPDTELMDQVLAIITAVPVLHNQERLAYGLDGEAEAEAERELGQAPIEVAALVPDCGSAHCFAGWVLVLRGYRFDTTAYRWVGPDGVRLVSPSLMRLAAGELGIPLAEAYDADRMAGLFWEDVSLEGIRLYVAYYKGEIDRDGLEYQLGLADA